MNNVEKELHVWMKQTDERLEKLEEIRNTPSNDVKMDISIGEFIRSQKQTTGADRTLLILHFKEKYEHIESWGIDELKEGYRQIRETLPPNPSDHLYQATKKGLIMEVTKKKKGNSRSYMFTHSGEMYIKSLILSPEAA